MKEKGLTLGRLGRGAAAGLKVKALEEAVTCWTCDLRSEKGLSLPRAAQLRGWGARGLGGQGGGTERTRASGPDAHNEA